MTSRTVSVPQALPAENIKIAATQILPGVTPVLNVGDVVQLTVRANPKEGLGLVFLRGQLIQAQLPQDVAIGDRLLARLEKGGEQIQFKILEVNTEELATEAEPNRTAAQVPSAIEHELTQVFEELIATLSDALPKEVQHFFLPEILRDTGPIKGAQQPALTFAQELAKTLVDVAQAQDANALVAALKAVTNGSASDSLRAIAESIRGSIPAEGIPIPAADRVLDGLRQVLVLLVGQDSGDASLIAKTLDKILLSLQEELRPERRVITLEAKDILRKVQAQLLSAKDDPADIQKQAQHALLQLDSRSNTRSPHSLKDLQRATSELTGLANRLDLLAATYDSMNQLNSVLHAFGEPALILFPFLLQGMITHSELIVDPDGKGNKKRKQDGDAGQDGHEEEGQGGADAIPFQRVQLAVPLPTLGLVRVEVAHRSTEVLTRITVASSEVASFLQEHMEDLTLALKDANLNLVDFTTGVGEADSKLLERRIAGETNTRFVA